MQENGETTNPESSVNTTTDTPAVQQPDDTSPKQALEPAPKKSKKWIVPSLIVILLLLIGIAGFITYKCYQLKKETVTPTQPTTQETTTPTPTTDPAENWETYTNTEYDYLIKYPSDVELFEGSGGVERLQETILNLFGPKHIENSEYSDGFGITVAVVKNPNNKTPDQFAQEYYQQAKENIDNKILEGDISKCKVESTVKDDIIGSRFTHCTQSPGSGIVDISEWYVKNNMTYQIYAVLQNENYLTVFNQILSTLKFTDSNSNTKEEVLTALENYLTALVDGDEDTAVSYLSKDVKDEAISNNFINMYEPYFTKWEILNEYHSEEEEEQFYNQERLIFNVKLYAENDKSGSSAKVLFLKENGNWKTLTWYLLP